MDTYCSLKTLCRGSAVMGLRGLKALCHMTLGAAGAAAIFGIMCLIHQGYARFNDIFILAKPLTRPIVDIPLLILGVTPYLLGLALLVFWIYHIVKAAKVIYRKRANDDDRLLLGFIIFFGNAGLMAAAALLMTNLKSLESQASSTADAIRVIAGLEACTQYVGHASVYAAVAVLLYGALCVLVNTIKKGIKALCAAGQ